MYQPYYGGYLPYYGAAPDQLAQLRSAQMPAQAQSVQPMQQLVQGANASQAQSGTPIWVQGEAGAKSYMVAPGNTVMLMDSENQVFYIKSADQSGMPLPLRIFDYCERIATTVQNPHRSAPESNALDPSQYITRREFEQWKASLTAAAVSVQDQLSDNAKEDAGNG